MSRWGKGAQGARKSFESISHSGIHLWTGLEGATEGTGRKLLISLFQPYA